MPARLIGFRLTTRTVDLDQRHLLWSGSKSRVFARPQIGTAPGKKVTEIRLEINIYNTAITHAVIRAMIPADPYFHCICAF